MPSAAGDGQHRSTKRVLSILELLAMHPDGMTMADICRELAAPKSSLFPILHTMAEEGFLAYSEAGGKYRIGIKAYVVGKAYNRDREALGIFKAQMERIVDTCQETCQVGILSHGDVLYIAKVDSPLPIRLMSETGRALPVHCTAIGKALVSEMSRDELSAIIGESFHAYTPRTIKDLDTLMDELEQVRTEGVAHDRGEMTDSIECLAVPIRVDGIIEYGLGISVPSYRLTAAKRRALERLLKESAQYLEITLS